MFDRPYVAQGAAQAIEDAGALGVILSRLDDRSQIPNALKIYEQARKERAEQTQQLGTGNQQSLHLPDGEEQRARDVVFAQMSQGGISPDRWGDLATQRFLWDWDAEASAELIFSQSTLGKVHPLKVRGRSDGSSDDRVAFASKL